MALNKLLECVGAWLFTGEALGDDAVDSSFITANTLSDAGSPTPGVMAFSADEPFALMQMKITACKSRGGSGLS